VSSGFIFPPHLYSLLKPAVVGDLLSRDGALRSTPISPFAEYLAQRWVDHVLFEDGAAWLSVFNIDNIMEIVHSPQAPQHRTYTLRSVVRNL
jgi:hypothetical protein